jgi:phage-related holin
MIKTTSCTFLDILTSKVGIILTPILTVMTFIATYFFNLTMNNYEQYIAIISVVFLDGIFGIIAGTKREGFKTFKAISVLRTAVVWILILTVLLSIEKGFTGSGWISETVLIPFMAFQIISALKNASMAGYIKVDLLNTILDKIDKHKGSRD